MPRFFVSVFVFCTLLWGLFALLLLKTAPVSILNILAFLVVLFLAVSSTLSIPAFYYFRSRKRLAFSKPNDTYRIGLRWSFFIGFGFVGILMLKAFDILNVLNGGIFLILYVLLYFYVRAK